MNSLFRGFINEKNIHDRYIIKFKIYILCIFSIIECLFSCNVIGLCFCDGMKIRVRFVHFVLFVCELVGNFLLSQLQHLDINMGLYRDDGLAITNATPRQTENIKKEICQIFNRNGLRITIEANKQVVNFLDVTLNLDKSTYQPFTKPNTTLLYVHRESNHPQSITRNIPAGINKRLSTLSSDKASFDQAAPPYQETLDENGYNYTLHYEPSTNTRRRNRPRSNILWYNPPFSKNVSTNIGHRFLSLVDKHFHKDHKLRKIFNRNTIKISYSCMSNTKRIIDNHNKRILNHLNSLPTPEKTTKHATADKRTLARLTETAFNHQ